MIIKRKIKTYKNSKVHQSWSWESWCTTSERVSLQRYLNFTLLFKMPLLLKKYFSRIVRLHLCNISLKIVDKHIWQWMWTVVIFQVTMKLRTTEKQISSCLCSRRVCINMKMKITNIFRHTLQQKHTLTHTHTRTPNHTTLLPYEWIQHPHITGISFA